MNSNPLISIVTPMYNAENFILETIESVLVQTYQNWEMIIVDNCSTDNSREIVKSINDKRIQLIELDSNSGGPAKPRNIGIKNSNGEYIAFLDADDVWLDNKLEDQIKFMEENIIDFSSTDFMEIDENSAKKTTSLKTKFLNKILTKKRNLNSLLLHNFIIQSSVMIKKSILDNFNYDEDKLLIAIEDYTLWLELFINKVKYAYLDKELVLYRILDVSTIDRNNRLKNKLRRNYAISRIIYKYEDAKLLKLYYKLICLKSIR